MAPLLIGRGPDEHLSVGSESTLDASILLFDAYGQVRSHADPVFYNRTNPSCQVVNDAIGNGAVRYDLREDCSTETALVVEKLDRHTWIVTTSTVTTAEWKCLAVGQDYNRRTCGDVQSVRTEHRMSVVVMSVVVS